MEKKENISKTGFSFFFCFFVLAAVNIINSFSTGFALSDLSLKPSWYFLVKQSGYVAVGLILFIVISKVKIQYLKYSSPVLVLACMLILVIDVFSGRSLIQNQFSMHFTVLSNLLYWSVFFSNRANKINNFSEMLPPSFFTVVTLFLVLVSKGLGYSLAYIFITVLMFMICGVGVSSVLLVIVYALIPTSVFFLSDTSRINKVLGFLVPGLFTEAAETLSFASKNAISSGKLLGKGLGNGDYKFLLGSRITEDYALCSFAEELGFVGLLVFFCVFVFFVVQFFVRANKTRENNLFLSDMLYGIGFLLSYQAIADILLVLGILPFEGMTFPFMASGPEIILFFAEASLIKKSYKQEESFAEDESNEEI